MKTCSGQKELEDLEATFKALAHKSRRHILTVLNARGGQMSAGDIAKRFACSWPTTTRHLRQLETANLVKVDKCGREHIYNLNVSHLNKVVGRWLKYFGQE